MSIFQHTGTADEYTVFYSVSQKSSPSKPLQYFHSS